MNRERGSIQRASVLFVLLAVLVTNSVVLAGITNYIGSNDGMYLDADNWNNGKPRNNIDGRIKGHRVIFNGSLTASGNPIYNLTVGFGANGKLTVTEGSLFIKGYKGKLYVGEKNDTSGNTGTGTVDIYGEIKLTSPQSQSGSLPLSSQATIGNADGSSGNVNVYDGGFFNAMDKINITRGTLYYEAGAANTKPRRWFQIASNGRVIFETDGTDVATVNFNSPSWLLAQLMMTGRAGMELSGSFSIGQTWTLFTGIQKWTNIASNENIISEQGYTFQFNKGQDMDPPTNTVSVTLIEAAVVQVAPASSRNVPADMILQWDDGTVDAGHTVAGYDVYWGIDPENLQKVITKTPLKQCDPNGDADLAYDTIHYGRVDVYDVDELDAETIITGGIWRYKVESAPICPSSDLDGDCFANLADFAILAADPLGFDMADVTLLAEEWLEGPE